jgi:hypothetical protein
MGLATVPFVFPLLVFATMLMIVKCGELFAKFFLPSSTNETPALVFLLGFAVTLLGLTVLSLGLNLSPFTALCGLMVAVATLAAFNTRSPRQVNESAGIDLMAVALVAISICCHGRFALSSPLSLQIDGVLTTWIDYYLHSETISSFGSPFAVGGDIEVAFARRPLYHYASYLLPAALQTMSGISGLVLATSLLLPLGLMVAAMGCYALAVEVGGRQVGLLALAIIISFPIPSSYLLNCGWYDFYWLLFISPGSGYGLGLACAASALVATYTKNGDKRVLLACGVVVAALAVTRMHFFILAAPVLALIVVSSWRPKLTKLLLGALAVAFSLGLVCLEYSDDFRQRWETSTRATEYLNFALQWSPLAQRFMHEMPTTSFVGGLALKVAATLVSILGAFAFIYPVLLLLRVKKHGTRPIDLLPSLTIASFILLILLTPPANHGDISEYKHRHFGLLYVYVVIFVSYYLSQLSIALNAPLARSRRIVWALPLILISSSISFGWSKDPGKANELLMPWAKDLQYRKIQTGLQETAEYIRKHAEPGDVFTTSASVAALFSPESPAAIIIGLTGLPSFLARSELKMTGSDCIKRLTTERMSILNKIGKLKDLNEVQISLRSAQIRWFIATPEEHLTWDPNREAAVFSKDGFSVYDAGRSQVHIPTHLACS